MSFEVEAIEKDTDQWNQLYALFQVSDPENLGYGRDVRSSGHYTGLTPVCAWSITAESRFNKYVAACEEVGTALESLGELPAIKTKLDTVGEDIFEINESVNEKVLLHGTRPETLLTLLQNGLSERFSKGLFGNGSYLAEDPSKIDQYCTPDTQEGKDLDVLHNKLFVECEVKPTKDMFYAIVCRVALGYPAFTKDGKTNSSPPNNDVFANDEKRELALIPYDGELPIHYHSLIAECGPASQGFQCARHREFIVFDSARIIEEYIIGYIRDMAPVQPGMPEPRSPPGNSNETDEAGVEAREGAVRAARTPSGRIQPAAGFPVGPIDGVSGISISPCGTFALVGSYKDDNPSSNWKVGHIDLASGKLSFPYGCLGGSPVSVAVAPDGSFALVATSGNSQIARIDLPGGKITEPYSKLDDEVPKQVTISPCGSFALVTCDGPKLARIDLSSSSGVATFPFGDLSIDPEGVAIAPNGKTAIVSASSGIWRLDLSDMEAPLEELHSDGRLDVCGHVSIALSGNFALVGAHPRHARVDMRTEEITFVDDYEEEGGLAVVSPMCLSISPDESFALVACADTGKVFCFSNTSKLWKPLPARDYTEDVDQPKSCCCSVM